MKHLLFDRLFFVTAHEQAACTADIFRGRSQHDFERAPFEDQLLILIVIGEQVDRQVESGDFLFSWQ